MNDVKLLFRGEQSILISYLQLRLNKLNRSARANRALQHDSKGRKVRLVKVNVRAAEEGGVHILESKRPPPVSTTSWTSQN